MARSVNNILTKGLKGMIGKQLVFRNWNGKTYISAAPKKPKKQSALQKENRSKFKQATQFAKNMMKDPIKKAEYQEIAKKLMLPNAYTAAITEYMRKPEVKEVDASNYSGRGGDEIKVVAAKKHFAIQEVEVIITDSNGEIIEEGKATKGVQAEWAYKATTAIKEKTSVHFLVRVKDRAGNYHEMSFYKSMGECNKGV